MSDTMTVYATPDADATRDAPHDAPSTLILAAHGSVRHASAITHIDALCASLRETGPYTQVRAAYQMGGPGADALSDLTVTAGATIVPYMMTDGALAASMTVKIADALQRRMPDAAISVGQAVGTHPMIAEIAADRAATALIEQTISPADAQVMLIAHGSEAHPASRLAAEAQIARVRRMGRFAGVHLALLEEAPRPYDTFMTLRDPGGPVVLIGLFAAPGGHAIDDIDEIDNAAKAIDEIDCINGGFVGLDTRMAEIVLDRARTARPAP